MSPPDVPEPTPGRTPDDGPDPGPRPPVPPALPRPAAARRAHYTLWLIWLVPVVAVVIGLALGVHAILARGPDITIYFHNADGIEAGKTHIRYKDVDIGIVKRVKLTSDHAQVEVTAGMRGGEGVEDMLFTDTRFWVVRPRVGAGGVSGLGTLLSGTYIGMDAGRSNVARREFQGLDVQPTVTADVPGRQFVLESDELGSLDIGSPIYLRRVPVGQVLSYEMTPDGRQIRFTIFVSAPYDRFVDEATRFWHASGVDFGIDAQGLHLQTQSVASLIAGGIAFEDLPDVDASKMKEAPDHSLFHLYEERALALQRPDANGFDYRLLFASSVRGLAVGAEVDYRGLPIGEVTRIGVQGRAGADNPAPLIAVDVRVYPRRLPSADKARQDDPTEAEQRRRIDPMVARGLRAQLRTGNLLTQQLYVALDYFPNTPKATVDWHPSPPLLPTVPGSFDSLEDSLSDLAAKLDRLPLETIAQDLHKTLTDVDTTLNHVDGLVSHVDASLTPEAQQTLAEARKALVDLQRTLDHVDQTVGPGANETLQEVSRAAQSLKALADALNRHPESLLRGKPEDPK